MKIIVVFLTLLFAYLIGCKENPVAVKPENRKPVIISLISFPEVIGPNDSVIVVCNAMDPDGDTLVYDWITSSRLRIKGANPSWDTRLFNTFENSRIFYPNKDLYPFDTVWIQCFARDRKGKSDAKLIIFTVINDTL